MKGLKMWLGMSLIALLAAIFVACGSDDDRYDSGKISRDEILKIVSDVNSGSNFNVSANEKDGGLLLSAANKSTPSEKKECFVIPSLNDTNLAAAKGYYDNNVPVVLASPTEKSYKQLAESFGLSESEDMLDIDGNHFVGIWYEEDGDKSFFASIHHPNSNPETNGDYSSSEVQTFYTAEKKGDLYKVYKVKDLAKNSDELISFVTECLTASYAEGGTEIKVGDYSCSMLQDGNTYYFIDENGTVKKEVDDTPVSDSSDEKEDDMYIVDDAFEAMLNWFLNPSECHYEKGAKSSTAQNSLYFASYNGVSSSSNDGNDGIWGEPKVGEYKITLSFIGDWNNCSSGNTYTVDAHIQSFYSFKDDCDYYHIVEYCSFNHSKSYHSKSRMWLSFPGYFMPSTLYSNRYYMGGGEAFLGYGSFETVENFFNYEIDGDETIYRNVFEGLGSPDQAGVTWKKMKQINDECGKVTVYGKAIPEAYNSSTKYNSSATFGIDTNISVGGAKDSKGGSFSGSGSLGLKWSWTDSVEWETEDVTIGLENQRDVVGWTYNYREPDHTASKSHMIAPAKLGQSTYSPVNVWTWCVPYDKDKRKTRKLGIRLLAALGAKAPYQSGIHVRRWKTYFTGAITGDLPPAPTFAVGAGRITFEKDDDTTKMVATRTRKDDSVTKIVIKDSSDKEIAEKDSWLSSAISTDAVYFTPETNNTGRVRSCKAELTTKLGESFTIQIDQVPTSKVK